MRVMLLVILVGCAGFGVSLILFGLGTPVAPDPSPPPADGASQLAGTQSYFQAAYAAARDLVQDLVEGFTAPIRVRTERIITPGPLPR